MSHNPEEDEPIGEYVEDEDEQPLYEAVLNILGLEVDMKDQVILKSYEDAMSDWAYSTEQLMTILESTSAEAYRQGQKNGVAWAIKVIDDLHIGNEYSDTTDRLFKGLKNTIRDRYKAETGVDPAPNYPVRVILQAQAIIQAKS
jgi:hypothetical protein